MPDKSLPKTLHEQNLQRFGDQDILLATLAQIHKDLSSFGIDFQFYGHPENPYPALHQQLSQVLDGVIKEARIKTAPLLYRIDVQEKALNRIGSEHREWSSAEVLSHAFIERELQKVLSRKYNS